jgi:hypothetical protein
MGCPRRRWATGGTGSSTGARPGWTVRCPAPMVGSRRPSGGCATECEQLQLALAEATVQLRIWQKGLGVRRRCPFADLEALRAAHGVSVSRFAALAGIPERTYWRRLARHRVGDPSESGRDRGSRREGRSGVARLGAPQDRRDDARRRPPVHLHRSAGPPPARTAAADRFRADRRSWARLRKRVFRDPTTPAEPGLADGLLRVPDRPRRDLADLRSHRLRHQVLPPPSPRRLAARMRSVASAGPLSRPNGSSTSTTSVPTAA